MFSTFSGEDFKFRFKGSDHTQKSIFDFDGEILAEDTLFNLSTNCFYRIKFDKFFRKILAFEVCLSYNPVLNSQLKSLSNYI